MLVKGIKKIILKDSKIIFKEDSLWKN